MTLQISDTLALPIDVTTMTSAIFGIRNSGKTNTATVLVEEALKAGQRAVILDPLDAWWGIKSSANGNAPGFNVVVFGGAHQDLPLLPDQGAILARLVVENPITAIFSLRHLRKHHQVMFAAEFLEELYHLKGDPKYRERLFLAIDEASAFVPQTFGKGGNKDGDKDYTARCVGAVEDTIRRGRNAGFGVCLIDQRPASVNKNALSQAELLIIHRVVSPQDRKALKEYSEANDDGGKSKELFDTIGLLGETAKGEAWIWSPYLRIFERIHVRMRETFDSSKTPEFGESPEIPTQVARIDLDVIRAMVCEAIAEAEANDPKTLKSRIAELEKQGKENRPSESAIAAEVDAALRPVEEENEALRTECERLRSDLEDIARQFNAFSQPFAEAITHALVDGCQPTPKRVANPAQLERQIRLLAAHRHRPRWPLRSCKVPMAGS